MFESCMVRGWVDILGAGQLPNAAEALHSVRVDDVFFDFSQSNVPINGVFDESPELCVPDSPFTFS